MSKVILAVIAALGLGFAQAASAADLPMKAPPPAPVVAPNWTGFYLGVNGGWGDGNTRHTDQFFITTPDFNQSGGLVGGTYGINGQFGKFVIGYEGDFDWANINGNYTNAVLCSVNGGNTCFTNLESFSTARLRAGFDVNGWLLYGTAGYGWGRVNAGQTPCGITVFGGSSCNATWRNGWVGGAGIEKMIYKGWSVKVEYLRYNFGFANNYQPAIIFGGNRVAVREEGDIVRVGLNYNFGWFGQTPVVAKY
jgi:outer membrane immunogenic protein